MYYSFIVMLDEKRRKDNKIEIFMVVFSAYVWGSRTPEPFLRIALWQHSLTLL